MLTRLTLLALSVAAGFIDAVSYLALGRVFTANMTGNTVLLGIAVALGNGTDAARSGAALGGFCVGVAAGVLAQPREGGRWPRMAVWAFAFEAAALAALLVVWAASGVGAARYWLIILAGIAMGAQSAAARTAPVGGVNTTYVTGTLTNAIARLVRRPTEKASSEEGPTLPGGVWAIYFAGAIAGAAAERSWHAAAVAVPLAIVCVVLAAARRADGTGGDG